MRIDFYMKLTNTLALFTFMMIGCGQVDEQQKQTQQEQKSESEVSSTAPKQESLLVDSTAYKSGNEPISVSIKTKFLNGIDKVEFLGTELFKGSEVSNLEINQSGVVTGDIVLLIRNGALPPILDGFQLVEQGHSMKRYRANVDIELYSVFKKLRANSDVERVELQIDYSKQPSTDETM